MPILTEPMTLLDLVVKFCERTGLPVPVAVMGSADSQIIQVRSLLEEGGDDLAQRGDWNWMTAEQGFITQAQEDQGTTDSLTSLEFRNIKNQTLWSRDRRLPVAGPLDAQQWQSLKALFVNGPYYRFRIRGGHLLVNPIPPAGEHWFFEYVTRNWILDPDTVSRKLFFTNDADLVLLPAELLLLDLRWRWKAEKGLEYAEAFRTFEMRRKDAMGQDGGKPPLFMDEGIRTGPTPGVFIPQGSWPVT